MTLRSYRASDYAEFMKAWCHRQTLGPIPEQFLPPTGLVARADDGAFICCAFLVKSDARVASVSFVCGNPEVSKEARGQALDEMILELASLAKDGGFPMVAVATNVPALQARFARLGFTMTDENVKCYGGLI